MEEKNRNTEGKILKTAEDVFIRKGKAAARMQEIADEAGINKALLHYYYRSKDKLFESVFTTVIKQLMLPKIVKIVNEESDVFEIIRKFADFYIGVLIKNPYIPLFVLEEINKNPQRLAELFISAGLPSEKLIKKIQKQMDEGSIKQMDPRQIFVNLIALCVFPLVARNMVQAILFKNNKREYNKFLKSRKTEVADFIINSIKT
ncbi:MAG: TetR/AcrR family transcriptional regulator [Bacteroidetes bacterium]|jgi:TetR/AcrR family transcriptional regulator|nr:TetR/AcrR family transcriptional regulator [Bacteroidota bacterium]MBT6686615.1 TetR/AcrR family transcriptional regulator [Bacteroidota bacterium]MBT7143818.1 TetR/AcrR family transcriptional regulator [Bacteroidota bacterium]MBT7491703.1 TetR/AcrR family transcriptional regulator [Bacteroidota bacterium]